MVDSDNTGGRRLTRRTSPTNHAGSPDSMSFGDGLDASDTYSKRMNDESLHAMSEGQSEQDSDLKAMPYKIVMLGDVSVGKTCIVQRYIYNQFGMQ